MSIDFYVAVHAPDWPTPAALNRCMAQLQYPVLIVAGAPDDADKPLKEVPNTMGLVVSFEGASLELEASIARLGPDSPYAYGLGPDLPSVEGISNLQAVTGPDAFVPQDLNANLREIGVESPDFKDGDYVLTLSFRSSVPEMRAGAFLMAGLIKCSAGLGFEFQRGTFGTNDFADRLAQEAADPRNWK